MSENPKVRDNRLRRAASRQGLTIIKNRRRDPRALDFGRCWLKRGDEVVYGGEGGVTIEEIEAYLTR
ncbi:hypothetical protein AB1207_01235 [Kineococcus endophyticus]|uniref:Uncharacterized protein n=1 Tax=Kineococcus endophyticus TaxID=1181883 RepID=A0ABV3P168_9ACTN